MPRLRERHARDRRSCRPSRCRRLGGRRAKRRSAAPSPVLGSGPQAVFGDARLHHAVFHHQRVVEHRHLGHAAVAVARIDIGAEQRILLGARAWLHAAVTTSRLARAMRFSERRGTEGVDQDAHRHAGRGRRRNRACRRCSGCAGNRPSAGCRSRKPGFSRVRWVNSFRSSLPGRYGQGCGAVM